KPLDLPNANPKPLRRRALAENLAADLRDHNKSFALPPAHRQCPRRHQRPRSIQRGHSYFAQRGHSYFALTKTGRRLDFASRRRQFRAPPGASAVGFKDRMRTYLSFETAVADIDARVEELRAVAKNGDSPALAEEIVKLEAKADKALAELYANLTPWQKTQVARLQGRPRFSDYLNGLITDFIALAGDRYFGEDQAIVGGLGRFEGHSVCILGQEKGNDTASRVRHNFGMARPEGYRKAVRLMHLANRFELPVISLIDTAGAFPGVDAEE